jgi:hypothetical protein
VSVNNTAIIATATSVAEPCSARTRLGRGDGVGCDGDTRQQRRSRCDRSDDQLALTPQLNGCPVRGNALRRNGGRPVPTRGEAGRLTRGIDATHLHRYRGEPRHAQHEDDDQGSDREGRLNRDAPGLIGQTLVFRARVMMLVSALTMESPVMTVYRIAPNAAAAMVPIAYSVV